jgi:hypothetical protein
MVSLIISTSENATVDLVIQQLTEHNIREIRADERNRPLMQEGFVSYPKISRRREPSLKQ